MQPTESLLLVTINDPFAGGEFPVGRLQEDKGRGCRYGQRHLRGVIFKKRYPFPQSLPGTDTP